MQVLGLEVDAKNVVLGILGVPTVVGGILFVAKRYLEGVVSKRFAFELEEKRSVLQTDLERRKSELSKDVETHKHELARVAELLKLSDQHRLAAYRERRAQLESLYEVLEEHRAGFNSMVADAARRFHSGKLGDISPGSGPPRSRLKMLIQLHFPELLAHLSEVQRADQRIQNIVADSVTQATASSAKRAELMDTLVARNKALDQAHDVLANQIADLAADSRLEFERAVEAADSTDRSD